MLILDEATSSIDTETEVQIQAALDTLMHERTNVVVAHRLSTVRRADCVAVLDAGHVIEPGNHDELVALNGRYARLLARQAPSAPVAVVS